MQVLSCASDSHGSQLLVYFLVLDQVPVLVEGTPTLPTLIGFLSRVDPLVLDEH